MTDPAIKPTLAVNPHGHLYWDAAGGEEAWPDPSAAARLAEAFASGAPQGLLHLGSREPETPLPAAAAFWREISRRCLSGFCRTVVDGAGGLPPCAPAPLEELRSWLERLPPVKGGEYLTVEALAGIWTSLDAHARAGAAAHPGGPAEFLKTLGPVWHTVGRVVFHLAENRKNENYPFAFLATYASGVSGHGRVRYQPLAEALKEYAGGGNKAALLRLLAPVHAAAEKSAVARELLETGALFKPLAWSPSQAYRFLKDASVISEGGVVVRLPDWWRGGRAPRARVGVRLGDAAGAGLGLGALLDFKLEKSLDGEPLREADWKTLMSSSGGLVLIRGRWIEADPEKLKTALEHWERVGKSADGVSLAEAMRLLSGADLNGGPADGVEAAAVREWSGVKAGGWLAAALAGLRDPGKAGKLPAMPGLAAELRPYQKTGVAWLRFMTGLGLGACLADDMGLGKTVQVLALLLARKAEQRAAPPSLIVAPASLLANWRAEIMRFAPSLKHRILHPSEMETDEWKALQKDAGGAVAGYDLVLTTYGLVARLESLRRARWDVVALDEAQAVKNSAARQTRAVKELACAQRLVLTGTPVENRLGDLWSIFDFLNPGLLGSAAQFGRFIKAGPRDGSGLGALRALAKPYILRRMKTDKSVITDLPEKTEVKAYCGLAPRQAALYEAAVRELGSQVKNAGGGIRRRGLVLSYLMRLKQICNHPSHWLRDGGYAEAESGKFQRLRLIAEEIASRQEKALVFTQFRELTGPLLEFLTGLFGRPGLALHGGTPVRARKGLVDAFQAENGPPFFVLTSKAGGSGLNLTEASHVIHFDRWWNPAVENQATDRAFRIGQKRNVLVHKFVCRGTLEERIDELIESKARLADSVIGGGGETMLTEMSDADLLKFVSLDLNRAAESQ
ncbi:MAG: DEAD/DEAH box helicase [Elusimicrobiales bacterium]|jgi:non-specific serine/threonine protein kinase